MEYIHIGKKIQEVLAERHINKTRLGEMIGMSASAAIYLTTRPTIDVQSLHKISVALKYNFFKHFPIEETANATGAVVWRDEKDKTIDELKLKIAALEKQLADAALELQKQENVFLKKINELLEKGK